MTYFNRAGEEFMPIGDLAPNPVQIREPEQPIQERDGLYFRGRTFPGLTRAVQACLENEQSWSELPLDAYQAWSEEGWKMPHLTTGVAQRFYAKAREEAFEAVLALDEHWETPNGTDHLVEEIGDVQWVTTAFATNVGSVVSDGLKQRLYDYAMGTRIVAEGGIEYPGWFDKAGELAIKRGSLTVGEVDTLFSLGFVPQHSAAMNLYHEEDKLCATAYLHDLQFYGARMKSMIQDAEDQVRYALHGGRQATADDMRVIAAETTLRTAGMAHQFNRTLAEVVEVNVRKITNRIQNNTIDKDDGDRDE